MDPYAPEFREDIHERTEYQKQQEAKESWSDQGVKPAAFVNAAGGITFGVCIGFVAILFQFNQYLGDCSRYTNQGACDDLTFAGCRWISPSQEADTVIDNATTSSFNDFCAFPDYATINCSDYFSQGDCRTADDGKSCYWQYHEKSCAHLVGWTSSEQGLLAGIQIVGSMIGALVSGPMANKLGRKKALAVAASTTALSCFFFTLGWGLKENYALLVLGEIIIGLTAGVVSVVCPMYCGEVVPGPKMQGVIGVFFQLGTTFGILLIASVGLLLDPENDTAATHAHLQARFYIVIGIQWATAAMMYLAAFCSPESPLWLAQQEQRLATIREERRAGLPSDMTALDQPLNSARSLNSEAAAEEMTTQQPLPNHQQGAKHHQLSVAHIDGDEPRDNDGGEDGVGLVQERKVVPGTTFESAISSSHQYAGKEETEQESNSLSDLFTRDNALPLAVGFTLAAGLQLTGINAIVVFDIKIAAQIDLSPLLGNFFLAFWNFACTFIPLVLVQKFSARQLYIGTMTVAAGAAFFTALGIFPGVFEERSDAQKAIGIVGILTFVCAFESGFGPMFFILAQDIFPARVRSLGTSYCVWLCFVFNCVINFGFPVAVTEFSGGPSGNQNKGLAISFIIFGIVATATAIFLKLFMKKTNSELRNEAAREAR